MKKSKYISFLLAVVLLFTVLAIPLSANAELDYSSLSKPKQYFLRLLGSLARADYYQTDVLASVTVTQAIYESGWGSHSLPIGGNNLFGIKAYSGWTGKVYDQSTSTLYNSYGDFLLSLGQIRSGKVSAWRAHENWAESVFVHSDLFVQNENYAPVVGEKDYTAALEAIVAGGYCNDDGYVEDAVGILESYGLDYYDDLTPDEDGIVAITSSDERLNLKSGKTHTLTLNYFPADKTPSSITWKSDNTSVAKVNKNGKITAVSHGTALITATLANGREACCIVYVDCNAKVIDESVTVRKTPSINADGLGKIDRGGALNILSESVYIDDFGNEYIKIEGYNSKDELVSGYVLSEYVYRDERNVSSITVVKDDITLAKGQKYTVVTSVAPADAVDAKLNWESSDTAVASVDENGVVTAKKAGNAVITASASGGASTTVSVTVAESEKNYKAIVTVADTLRVRAAAAWSASSLGSVEFLSEVTVHGEPQGYWYNISGTSTRGKEINGYVFSTYLKLLSDDESVSAFTTTVGVSVYESANTTSEKVATLASNGDIAVIGAEKDGWSYVVGKDTSGNAVYGYAKLDGSGEPVGDIGSGELVSGWYGLTTDANLNVRDEASTNGNIVGKFAPSTQIIITGEENGWYKVIGKGIDGKEISGYSSAEHVFVLYNAEVTGVTDTLNIRSEPTTDSESLGKLNNAEKLIVIGEVENDWYNVKYGDIIGYCWAEYIKINGKMTVEVESPSNPDTNPDNGDFSITDANLSIKDGILNGVGEDTTTADLLNCFTGNVTIIDKSGNKLSTTDLVGTGCEIRVTSDGKTATVATVIVKGDVNGDGDITSMDYILIKRCFFGTYKLEGVYLTASLVSGEKELTVLDYIMIKRVYFGTYKL